MDEDDLKEMWNYKRKNLNSCMILTNTVNASSSGICSYHDHDHGQEHDHDGDNDGHHDDDLDNNHDHDDDQIIILNHDFPPA